VNLFAADIRMEFGLDRRLKLNIRRGKSELEDFEMQQIQIMEPMDESDAYKYFGV
jgi:hypothetical protein